MMLKRLTIALISILLLLVITGCGREAIFKEREKPESTIAVKVGDLETDTYYVKDGTDFYKMYKADKNFTGDAHTADSSRVIWNLEEQDDLLPVLYKNEPLVFAIDADIPQETTLERFKDIGYSLGVRELSENENGMFQVDGQDDMKSGSAAMAAFQTKDKEGQDSDPRIAIDNISGKKLTEDNISSSNTITGLKKNKTYQLDVYVGSKYAEVSAKADTHIYQSSETVSITSLSMTKNGYVAIDMPENLQSGYYYLSDGGMFKYVAVEKGEKEDDIDYNVPNETVASRAVDDTLKETSKEQVYKADKKYKSMKVMLHYDTDQTVIKTAYIKLPSGEKVEIEGATKEIDDIEIGTYTVFVKGKNIDLVEIEFLPGEEVKEEEEEEKEEEKEEKEQSASPPAQQTPKKQTGSSGGSSTNKTPSQSSPATVYEEVPVTDPLNQPEISGTIGD